MATASSNVQVKFTLRGEDRASSVINNVGRSADSASGGFAALGRAALGAGAALAAIAAAGGAAVRLAKMAESAERLRASMDFAGGGRGGFARIVALSDRIGGVGAESVGRFAAALRQSGVNGAFTADQLQRLTGIALTVGKTGDDALTALAQAVENANTRALKSIGIFINNSRVQKKYADRIGTTTTELTALQQRAAVVEAVQKQLAEATATSSERHAALDTALADLNNRFLELKVSAADVASPGLAALTRQMSAATKAALNLLKAAKRLGGGSEAGLAGDGGGPLGALARFAGASELTPAARARIQRGLELRPLRNLPSGGTAEMFQAGRVFFGRLGNMLEDAGKGARKIAEGAANLASRGMGALAARRHRGRATRGRAAGSGAAVNEELFGFLVGGEGDRLGAAALGEEFKLAKTKQQLRMEEMADQLRLDAFADFMHQKDMERLQQKTDMYTGVASSVAGSVAGIMKMMGAEEQAMRVQAGVEGLIALARAKVAFGMGKIPQAVALAAGGAGLLAQAAVGTGSSGGGGRPSGRFFGGADQFVPSAVGATAAGGGGRTVVVNFGNGVVLGNPHEVARTIKGALAVSSGTGF